MAEENTTQSKSVPELYQASVQHWSHAEQIRWTLLYNYLMASTILLLAWATVFASVVPHSISWPQRISLLTLPTAGLVLSALWVALGKRASSFAKMYAEVGRAFEPSGHGLFGPFLAASVHRTKLRGLASWVPSRRIILWVPVLFGFVYIVLIVISVYQ